MLWRKQKLRNIDSPLYKYRQALYLSFYSRKLYIDVVKRWRGLGIKYFLFFFIIACIPFSIKSMIDMNNHIKYDLLEPIYLVPKFKVENGKVQFSKKMPYFIRNHLGKVVAIIDTTGLINEINDEYPDLLLLVNSNKIHLKFPKLLFLKNDKKNAKSYNNQETLTHDLSEIEDDEFDGSDFIKEAGFVKIKNYFLVFVYPIIVSALFGMFTTVILALAIMGQVASYAIFKHQLSYKQASRISVISSSIGIWIYLCLKTFDIYSYTLNFMCMTVVFIYFSYGVLAVKRDSRNLVHY